MGSVWRSLSQKELPPEILARTKLIYSAARAMWLSEGSFLDFKAVAANLDFPPREVFYIVSYAVAEARMEQYAEVWIQPFKTVELLHKFLEQILQNPDFHVPSVLLRFETGLVLCHRLLSWFGGTFYYLRQWQPYWEWSLVPLIVECVGPLGYQMLIAEVDRSRYFFIHLPSVEKYSRLREFGEKRKRAKRVGSGQGSDYGRGGKEESAPCKRGR